MDDRYEQFILSRTVHPTTLIGRRSTRSRGGNRRHASHSTFPMPTVLLPAVKDLIIIWAIRWLRELNSSLDWETSTRDQRDRALWHLLEQRRAARQRQRPASKPSEAIVLKSSIVDFRYWMIQFESPTDGSPMAIVGSLNLGKVNARRSQRENNKSEK
jgi:hypothetical protein